MQTNPCSNIQPKLLSCDLYSKAMQFMKENRRLLFLIAKKVHLKLVCTKRFNCRDEARNSLKNVKKGTVIFQEIFLVQCLDALQILVVEVMIFNKIRFSLFHTIKSSLCVEREMIFPHHFPVFNRSSWFLSMPKSALLARNESQMAKSIPIPSTSAEGSKFF